MWDCGSPTCTFIEICYWVHLYYYLIIFYSVWFNFYKNNNKIKIKKKTKQVQMVWFCWTKTGSNRFGSVFSGLARFFPVWLGFSVRIRFGSVWFFRFQAYKTETKQNWTGWFFQNFNWFNRFFFMVWFFRFLFLFSRFNRFFSFFAYPYLTQSNFQRFCGIDESTIVIFKNIFGLF
jgi:hypothetical protein